jgi:hypothetical protein
MPLTRITAALGAVALGGLLVASSSSVGASASPHHQRPAHQRTVVYHEAVGHWHATVRPDLRLRIGRHCGSMEMSM